jgi:hypothetical protein
MKESRGGEQECRLEWVQPAGLMSILMLIPMAIPHTIQHGDGQGGATGVAGVVAGAGEQPIGPPGGESEVNPFKEVNHNDALVVWLLESLGLGLVRVWDALRIWLLAVGTSV